MIRTSSTVNRTLNRPSTSKQNISRENPKATATQGKTPGPSAFKTPSKVSNNALNRPSTSKGSVFPKNPNQTAAETRSHDGYTYEKCATTNDSSLWQCVGISCKAKYRIMHRGKSIVWEVKNHNHVANGEKINEIFF